jgi:hypothetical protein
MGVAPEAILEKDFFEYRLEIECNPSYFNSKYFNLETLYLLDTLRTPCRRRRIHNSIKDFQSLSLRVVAPKAIIEKSFTHNLL